jgi:hypothetical protein
MGICKADEMIFSHKIFSVLPLSHEDKVVEISLLFSFVASKKWALQAVKVRFMSIETY